MTGGCSRSAGRRPTTPGHIDIVSAWPGVMRTSIALRTWRHPGEFFDSRCPKAASYFVLLRRDAFVSTRRLP